MEHAGIWKTRQLVRSWMGFDGTINMKNFTNGFVNYFDLTKPRYLGRMFHWVTSFEVGEHIPEKYEMIFLENLTKHAKEGVILSWVRVDYTSSTAIGHVNQKDNEYVAEKMKQLGFEWDETLQKIAVQYQSVAGRFGRSLMAYRRNATFTINNGV
jgi:hypothetical protein